MKLLDKTKKIWDVGNEISRPIPQTLLFHLVPIYFWRNPVDCRSQEIRVNV